MRRSHPGRRDERLLIAARALRGAGDGLILVLLPPLLLSRGFGAVSIGDLTTATLLGSALATLAAGLLAHRASPRAVLFAASALLALTGLGFVFATSYVSILLIGFAGTFNPTGGDVSVFLPIEQALLAGAGPPEERTARYARYNVAGAIGGGLGAGAAGLPGLLGVGIETSARVALGSYAALGLVLALLYLPLRTGRERAPGSEVPSRTPLRRSRGIVLRLAALFSLDSFGGGFAAQALVIAWLIAHFGASVELVALAMAVSSALSGLSQLAAPALARRIGLIRTMVYTHLPANVFLIASAFMPTASLAILCLWLRASLSQMDVPARQAFVMSVVPEQERSAAASVTNVPRSLFSAASPLIAGHLLATGAFSLALVLGGGLKIAYDLLLLAGFRRRRAQGEESSS